MCTAEVMKRTRWIVSELRGAKLVSEVEVIESTKTFHRAFKASSYSYRESKSVNLRIMGVSLHAIEKQPHCVQISLR